MKGYLGIDLGTSGCRVALIDDQPDLPASLRMLRKASFQSVPVEGSQRRQSPTHWWQVLSGLLDDFFADCPAEVQAICVDGTSATLLAIDETGKPLCDALMYNDASATAESILIDQAAAHDSTVRGATSSLAKRLYLQKRHPFAKQYLHQADWISGKLLGRFDYSDENNCLKMGYDARTRSWPDWLEKLGIEKCSLPNVVAPGTPIGFLSDDYCKRWKLSTAPKIIAGTTDSTAAFLATGAHQIGDAVTCLGSTLVMKVLSDRPLFEPARGVYSHRILGKWLVGGASNSGGQVLRHYFSNEQLQAMTPNLAPDQPTGLDYYPLIGKGERFPVQDAEFTPCLTPRPLSDLLFFQAMLEGMSRIERESYELLQQLGAPYPRRLFTTGGGSGNPAWQRMREQALGVVLIKANQQEAAYGSALLAKIGANS